MAVLRVSYGGVVDLADDMVSITRRAPRDMKAVVRQDTLAGKNLAQQHAKRTSGRHGKHYPRAITWETGGGFFGGTGSYTGEFGPDSSRKQGRMSFEDGSRNQPPHRDLAFAHRTIAPVFGADVAALPGRWFWKAA